MRPCLALLQVGFTEPPRSPGALVVSYTTVSPLPVPLHEAIGGLFSVALSVGSPRLGVTQHPALWSPDFPQASGFSSARGHPANSFFAPMLWRTRPQPPSVRVVGCDGWLVPEVVHSGRSVSGGPPTIR